MMKKLIYCIVFLFFSTGIMAQIPETPAGIKPNAPLQKTLVYNSIRELPAYLIQVKTAADLNKTLFTEKPPKANMLTVINSKEKSSFNNFLSRFAEGMNYKNGIPSSRFLEDTDTRFVLLTTELTLQNQRAVLPVKNSAGFLFLLSAPMSTAVYMNSVL